MNNTNSPSSGRTRRKPSWLGATVLSAALVLFGMSAKAQVSSYAFATSSTTFTSIDGLPGTFTINTGSDDTGFGPYALGFSFVYNGVTYTTAGAQANGFIAMGALPSSSYTAISSGASNNVISAYNRDLYGLAANGAKMLYQLSGTPGSQVFTFEWKNWGFYSAGTAMQNFQIQLFEGTNVIRCVYQNGSAAQTSGTVQVGLRGASSADFANRSTTTNWLATTAGAVNSATCSLSSTVRPGNGTTFTWTPPTPCSSVSGGTAAATVSLGCGTLASSTLSVTGSTTGVTGLSYQWYSGPVGGPYTTPLGTGITQVVTGLTTTTAYVRTTTCANGGATATSTEAVITINPAITATASAAPAGPFCGAANTVLTATGGLTYAWLPVTGLSDPTSANPTSTATTTTTYTVTATGVGGCTGTATVTVTVVPNPVFSSVTATPATICVNGNSQLQANATQATTVPNLSFAQSSGTYTPNVGGTSILAAGTDDGNSPATNIGFSFNFNGTVFTQFVANANGNIRLGAAGPTSQYTPISTAGNTNAIAAAGRDGRSGVNTLLTGAPGSRVLTIEYPDFQMSYLNANNPLAFQIKLYEGTNAVQIVYGSGSALDTYTAQVGLRGSTTAGDVNTRTTTTNWNASTAGTQTSTMSWGTTVTVPASGLTFTWTPPALAYAWTPNTYLNFDNIANPLASAVAATTAYSVTATGFGGCTATSGVTVTTSAPISAATITGTLSFCAGGSTTLTAVPTDGGGPYTYLWSPGGETTASITVTAAGSYSSQVNDNCGGSVNTGSVTVVANPVPTASASSNQGCTGQTLNLTGTTDIGTGFSWSGPNLFASTSQNPSIGSLTAAAAGTYTFTASLNGCSSLPATVVVSVNNSPVITSTTATPGTICPGSSSQLQVNIAGPAAYCTTSSSSGTAFGDYASLVQVAGTTLNSVSGASPSPYYTLFPATGATTGTFVAGTAYVLTVSAGTYTVNDFAAWIDYNADGVFTDATEKLGQVNDIGAAPVTANINFTVPLSAVSGQVRMRVRESDQGGLIPACGAQTYGETEDYDITITGGASAAAYSWNNGGSLSASNIANPVATPAATTPYTVDVTANGCTSQGTATVTVAGPVDDGNVCTLDACLNGVVTNIFQDADGDLTCDANDGCPIDPLKTAPGQCGCGVADTDTDGDLTADCNDLCPADPLKTAPGQCGCGVADTDSDNDGTANCNDGCPLDPLKLTAGLCGCGVPEGTCNDCEGTPAGPAQPGTACNDNNVCTINDTWTVACACVGTFQDSDGDSVCDANDICPGANDLLDTDLDGLVDCLDNCPLIAGQIGSACNDGNPNTTGDAIDANCVCAGTVPPCPDNLTVLTLTTDNNGAQTSWEVVPQGGGAPVCSGSGQASSISFAYNCCLPSGCYNLRVLDSFGDGMNSGTTGGYVLRDANNARIIDNAGDGIFTFTSQAPDVFCVPISTDRLTTATCDQENVAPSYVIQAQENLAVSGQLGVTSSTSGYQFWIFNPDGGYTRRITQTLASPGSSFPTGTLQALRPTYLRLNSLTTNPVPPYVLLNVRVRIQTAGVFGQFGSACRLKVDPPCGTTQLTTLGQPVNPAASCSATGVVINGGLLYADVISGANRYQFEFTRPGYSRLIAVSSRTLTLSNWATKPLLCGLAYSVRVRASFDNGATWCAFGSGCTISTEACPAIAGGDDRELITVDGSDLTVWPNPNRGESLRLSIDDLGASFETANVDITDMFGKRVMAQTIAVQGTTLNTVLELTDMAAGMYMVNVTVGEKTYMKRLMIQ